MRETVGFGATRQEAIAQALIEAVSQVKGIKIEASQVIKSSLKEEYRSSNGIDTDHSKLTTNQDANIRKATKGVVDSYKVTKVRKASNGYEAHLMVTLSEYKVPGLANTKRRKLAVLPFHYGKQPYQLGQHHIDPVQFEKDLNQALVTALTQTRRFSVVDRSYLDEYQSEKAVILSGDLPVQEQAKLGQALGLDYMVVGTIGNVVTRTLTGGIELIGEQRNETIAHASVDYRVIAMASRQVKWAATAEVELAASELVTINGLKRGVTQSIAERITVEMIDNIYPMRIVSIDNSRVILNQGGSTLKPGSRLDVFNLGKKLIDPYTRESLGQEENWIAQVEIDRVLPKQAYGLIVAGESSQIGKNAVVRHPRQIQGAKTDTDNPLHRQAESRTLDRGGVELGF